MWCATHFFNLAVRRFAHIGNWYNNANVDGKRQRNRKVTDN